MVKQSGVIALLTCALIITAASAALSQEPSKPAQATKPRAQRTEQATPATAPADTEPVESENEALRRTLSKLSDQIGALNTEVRRLREQTERSSLTLEVLLNEERLGKAENKVDEEMNYKNQLEGREQEIQRRLRNIQQELMLRGVLRREEAEVALRAELNRQLEDTREQLATQQQRIAEAQSRVERIRHRVAELNKRLEPAAEKPDNQQE